MNVCEHISTKGKNKGVKCTRQPKNGKLCSKHRQTIDQKTEVSDIDIQIQNNEEVQIPPPSIPETNTSCDDILITKYFVYDCIRDFLRDHKEVNDLLSIKKESNSNFGNIITMAGIGLVPLLLKNLTNSNILNALHKSENDNEIRPRSGNRESTPQFGTYNTIERTEGETTTSSFSIPQQGEMSTSERIQIPISARNKVVC